MTYNYCEICNSEKDECTTCEICGRVFCEYCGTVSESVCDDCK